MGPGTRSRGRTPRRRFLVRGATDREQKRPRGRSAVASRATEEESVQAVLDDASDASIDPRMVAADSGAPSLLEVFGIEDQERAEQAVSELEQIEASAEAAEEDGVSDAIPAVPRLPPTPAQVRIQTKNRFNRHVYNAFVVCGATTRVAAINLAPIGC